LLIQDAVVDTFVSEQLLRYLPAMGVKAHSFPRSTLHLAAGAMGFQHGDIFEGHFYLVLMGIQQLRKRVKQKKSAAILTL